MAQKSSYTDIVHFIVRDSEENLSLNEIVEKLSEVTEDSPPKNPRSTARSAIRNSILIQSVGRDQHGWLPRLLQEARIRVTLHERDLSENKLFWDTDALLTIWPAFDEPETRRERPDVNLTLESGAKLTVSLQEEEEVLFTEIGPVLRSWLDEMGAKPGDDLVVWCADPTEHLFEVSFLGRSDRNEKLIKGRNRSVKRKMEEYLATQRDHLAKPREIMASLVASRAYLDSIPPQSLSNLLPEGVVSRYGARVPEDKFEAGAPKESKVIPFPKKAEESLETSPEGDTQKSSVALDIPFNTGRELPDEKAYFEGLQMLEESGGITPGLAIHVLNLSRICSPAYAMLSQTAEYRREALDLAGQSVVAAERRIAHGLVESLITGEEFAIEEAVADYLESRSFLARALWHAGNVDDAIEQAMHCFEVDPEDPAVREDLFVMLFDTDRHDMVVRLLESFPGASVTEELYHKALGQLLEDPEGREAKKVLRKAVSHNSWLASRFLGEDPKKAKRSSIEEGTAYEEAYGFLWRREDVIFDMLEEIVLAKR
jgi:tetratricopeptide (TPR) repeat protein